MAMYVCKLSSTPVVFARSAVIGVVSPVLRMQHPVAALPPPDIRVKQSSRGNRQTDTKYLVDAAAVAAQAVASGPSFGDSVAFRIRCAPCLPCKGRSRSVALYRVGDEEEAF